MTSIVLCPLPCIPVLSCLSSLFLLDFYLSLILLTLTSLKSHHRDKTRRQAQFGKLLVQHTSIDSGLKARPPTGTTPQPPPLCRNSPPDPEGIQTRPSPAQFHPPELTGAILTALRLPTTGSPPTLPTIMSWRPSEEPFPSPRSLSLGEL